MTLSTKIEVFTDFTFFAVGLHTCTAVARSLCVSWAFLFQQLHVKSKYRLSSQKLFRWRRSADDKIRRRRLWRQLRGLRSKQGQKFERVTLMGGSIHVGAWAWSKLVSMTELNCGSAVDRCPHNTGGVPLLLYCCRCRPLRIRKPNRNQNRGF